MVIYFDGILVYSSSEDEYMQHLREVLTVLQDKELYINLKKCSFMSNSLIFLVSVVSSQGIHVDEDRVKVIRVWPTPKNVIEVSVFH